MKKYYPTYWSGCNPIHEVKDWSYVRKIIRARKAGKKIPPIVIDGDRHNGCILNGTHRCAANDLILMMGLDESLLVEYVTLDSIINDYDGLKEAVENGDYEEIDNILD